MPSTKQFTNNPSRSVKMPSSTNELYNQFSEKSNNSFVNIPLKLYLSISDIISNAGKEENISLQKELQNVRRLTESTTTSSKPLPEIIKQNDTKVNSSKTNFLRYFPEATKMLREKHGLTARWIIDFIDRLDHCQTIFGGSWSHTNKQWADILGCSVRTFKSALKIAEKELQLVIINRDCYKRRDGVYIKQYRYSLNPEGIEKLKDVWFSRSKSKELQKTDTPELSMPTGKCKKSTNIIVNHKSKDLSKFNKENETNLLNDFKEKKEFEPENFIPDGVYYDLAQKKIGKYHSMITEARNFADYCVNSERFKDKTFTQYEMNGLFVNWWLERRANYLYKHNPLRLIPFSKRLKYNQNLKSKPAMQKETYYEPETIEKDTTAKILYQGAMISLDEYHQLLNRNQRKITPEQDAEFDREIERLKKELGLWRI